jgi:hypothetical protein
MAEKSSNTAMRYAGLATQWMVMLAIAVWVGYKLDEKTGWKFPLFIILLPLIALGISLWRLIKEVSKPKE